jgi:uncharacterized membrane protein
VSEALIVAAVVVALSIYIAVIESAWWHRRGCDMCRIAYERSRSRRRIVKRRT